jgi:AraC-like DNA-binding protein
MIKHKAIGILKQYYKPVVCFIIPIVLLIIGVFTIYQPSYNIVPNLQTNQEHKLTEKLFTDTSANGNSVIQFFKSNNEGVKLKYILREKYLHAFVGISFEVQDSAYLDISGYDYLSIKLKSKRGTRIPVTFSEYVPTYNSKGQSFKYRNQQYIINVSKQLTESKVSLKDFKTPDWWYVLNSTKETDFGPFDQAKIKNLIVGNCYNLPKNVADEIEIQEISLHVNYRFYLCMFALFFTCYYAIVWWFLWREKQVYKTELKIQYDKIEAVNYADKEENAVFNYIAANFRNQELTIIDIQNVTGIHERKISGIIKNKTELNFKQLLNKIRLTEAKRLLAETDLQIAEIADKVGYGNTTHFNRVFKLTENCSPNDYRKEFSKK